MSREIRVTTILLLIVSVLSVSLSEVKIVLAEPISYTSGVTVYSPVSTTYTTNNVMLNLTFIWGLGMDCSLNYSIDEGEQQPISLVKQNSEIHVTIPYTGSVELQPLANGQHTLSIYVSAESASYSNTWTHIIYFTIDGDSNIIPEFPSWILLHLFFVGCLVVAGFRRKMEQ